jgi:hypothetical protein
MRALARMYTLPAGMASGSAVRNRSEIVTVVTARGHVEVARQELRGLRRGSGWRWFWVARRSGKTDWCEASTASEVIRRATLLPPRKPPAWLSEVAADAERQIMTAAREQVAEDVRQSSSKSDFAA